MLSPATSGRRFSLTLSFHFLFFFFTRSGALTLTITPDRGTNIRISSFQVLKGCQVCTGSGRQRNCSWSVLLKDPAPTTLDFTCSAPQDHFSVEVTRNIECSLKSCSGHIVQADAGSLPLLAFDRKFTWTLQAATPAALRLDFRGEEGLRQVNGSVGCQDHHSYSLQVSEGREDVVVGRFCRRGPISSAQILSRGRFSLEVPGQQRLQRGQVDVSVGQEIKTLAKVTVTLPRGRSSVQLFSPNYPHSFPDDDVMEWFFQLPQQHWAQVLLVEATRPHCQKKSVALEYRGSARGAAVLSLTDPQPQQNQGNFSLMLRNCKMESRRSGSPGLVLSFKVSSSTQSSQASCRVDARQLEGSSLHIRKLRPPASDCQMKVDSVLKEEATVRAGAELWFQDCLPDDLQVTVSRTIECRQFRDCPRTPTRLTLPLLPSCVPAPLSSATFSLSPPVHGTVELTPPSSSSSSGALRQALPGQPCSPGGPVVEVSAEGGTLGHFCLGSGAISRMQVHTAAVRLTVTGTAGQVLQGPVMSVLMKEEITERFMFFVSPKRDLPVLLATPGWPGAMGPYSTVSWLVSIPPGTEAHLTFANLSQPKCSTRHTSVRVQRLDRREEDYSRREDEPAEDLLVRHSFYLNMSNCMPEMGHFRVLTKLTLKKSSNVLLTIILSVVAALVLVLVLVLAVVCVVIKRKKKKLSHQVSIYNPNSSVFLPGMRLEAEHEHEYASIEDTLVYTHLLRKAKEVGVYGDFDTYRPYADTTGSQKPLVTRGQRPQEAPPLPSRPLSHSGDQAHDQTQDQNHSLDLVDNIIYRSREEHRGSLGPRLDPEGGN